MDSATLKRYSDQREALLSSIKQTVGDDFIVSSNMVLSCMSNPEDQITYISRLFEEFPKTHELDGLTFQTHLFDLLQFATVCALRGQELIGSLIEELSPEVLLLLCLHDSETIRNAAISKLGGTILLTSFDILSKNKLSAENVTDLVEVSPTLIDTIEIAIHKYKLHDPDENQLSSYLKEFGGIKSSRILYFTVSKQETWPKIGDLVQNSSKQEAKITWNSFCTEKPCYPRFCRHIQATVYRIILLKMLFHKEWDGLEIWKSFLNETNLGHDGSPDRFNRETIQMIDRFSKGGWITNHFNR